MNEPTQHALVQAPIEPLDEDGVTAAVAGTIVSAVATVVLWWRQDWLTAHDQGWWVWVGATSVVAGLVFTGYTLNRRRIRLNSIAAINQQQLTGDASDEPLAETASVEE